MYFLESLKQSCKVGISPFILQICKLRLEEGK